MDESQIAVLSAWKKDRAVCAYLELKNQKHLDLLELSNGFYTIFPNSS